MFTKGPKRPSVHFMCFSKIPFSQGHGSDNLGWRKSGAQGSFRKTFKSSTPAGRRWICARYSGPAPARDRDQEGPPGPWGCGRGSGDEAAQPALRVPPSQPPGPAAAGPLGLGLGEAGVPGEGPGLPAALTSQPAAPLFSFFSSP